eukprot:TRINITY_DN6285_c0_g4_i1.p1 TRINITY_DN6285_c0_g4~~TRINITY_DN6285_c0_g4_i1.p1  ORF type:complete len:358 (+),score=51.19 TRINITY_DN6285_c0_g4_i1:52-1125(+)
MRSCLLILLVVYICNATQNSDFTETLHEEKPCGCSLGRTLSGATTPSSASAETTDARTAQTNAKALTLQVLIPGGTFRMGQEDPRLLIHQKRDGEGPKRTVTIRSFYLDEHTVTNAQFQEFVIETGYITDAEKYNWSFVFEGFAPKDPDLKVAAASPWWVAVPLTRWDRPFGPESNISNLSDHPVVHVSWFDAYEYCKWSGKRLPTEAEHERASKAGLKNKLYPWGNELHKTNEIDKHRCNIWQGKFPDFNTGEDGYVYTAPSKSFEPNGYGLYNMVGNVWEWVNDWWTVDHDKNPLVDPKGPKTGSQKVQRGGSYLCHDSYCWRYRTTARIGNEPDTSTGNIGFRCAKDVQINDEI